MGFHSFNLSNTHKSWHPLLEEALSQMDKAYLKHLAQNPHWLPGKERIFNAFSLPLNKTKRILLGESPYPRKQSANGYAFWDNAVGNIFREFHSTQNFQLSKEVNRATSLRNFLKMLLRTQDFPPNMKWIQTLPELFERFIQEGFLLLNASLVFQDKNTVKEDAKQWRPFIFHLLKNIYQRDASIEILMFGKIAKLIDPYLIQHQLNFKKLIAEHPYNLSFIQNPLVLEYFKNFRVMQA